MQLNGKFSIVMLYLKISFLSNIEHLYESPDKVTSKIGWEELCNYGNLVVAVPKVRINKSTNPYVTWQIGE